MLGLGLGPLINSNVASFQPCLYHHNRQSLDGACGFLIGPAELRETRRSRERAGLYTPQSAFYSKFSGQETEKEREKESRIKVKILQIKVI